jgi:DNA helicase II / ATP-dependent DNA helicase PcrA
MAPEVALTAGARFPTPEQRQVLEHVHGAHLVLAPAGSGKTQVMTARLRAAIEAGVAPERTLCVTFTNRAAEEMRARIAIELPEAAKRAHVRTFHGLCAWLLRSFAPRLGLPRDFTIYDEQDAIEVLAVVMTRSNNRISATDPKKFFFTLAERKSGAQGKELSLARIPPLFAGALEEPERNIATRYHRVMADRAALDFADLVYRVRSAFELDAVVRDRVENLFDWVQIDEVQDTHASEYDVIRRLALRTKDLALFGDIDQTIYEWRGSDPESILGRFRRDFQPVREHILTRNFRATKHLLRAADAIAKTFERRRTILEPDPSVPAGEPPVFWVGKTATDEAAWIARQCAELREPAEKPRIGILGRNHARLTTISEALTKGGVPHVTVEEFEFFRRQEIKDILARLRLVLQPDDSGAVRRALLRPASKIGPATWSKLEREGPAAGLRLADLVRERTHDSGEPFANLLGAFAHDRIVVFDVETTGLSTSDDEVIEIAALEIVRGKVGAPFRRLIRPRRSVGDSEQIHGYDDATLAREGEDAATVFAEFLQFARDAHLVGHNVRFDLAIVQSNCARLNIDVPRFDHDDTLDLARRFVTADRFDLESLAAGLSLESAPTHRALDDVRTTAELLIRLIPDVSRGAADRERLVKSLGQPFQPLSQNVARWREMAKEVRPPVVLKRVLEESGLSAFYQREPKRLANLDDLQRFFNVNDRGQRPPSAALADLVQFTALARNVDHLRDDDDRIPVVTVHQAKGLEFDVVFVAGVADGEFPSYLAKRDGRVEEERRLFYVALTRARKRLYLSAHEVNERGYAAGASEFFLTVRRSVAK